MRLTVDRIEEDILVCEDEEGNIVNISKDISEFEIREKDIIEFENGKISLLEKENLDRKSMIAKITEDLWEK